MKEKGKGWHFIWILWLVLAVVNLLLINVYINHLGVVTDGVKALGDLQMMGYVALTLLFLVLVGVWWLLIGGKSGKKGVTVLGAICTAVFGLALIGSVVYVLAFGGAYIRLAVDFLAGKLSFLSF